MLRQLKEKEKKTASGTASQNKLVSLSDRNEWVVFIHLWSTFCFDLGTLCSTSWDVLVYIFFVLTLFGFSFMFSFSVLFGYGQVYSKLRLKRRKETTAIHKL